MASLADIFNPSFFIILGIVALLIALMVVYFESKVREQNHKMSSMLSLVSTLAEDMNGVKMGLNHLAISGINGGNDINHPEHASTITQKLESETTKENKLNLIEVSDDESEQQDNKDQLFVHDTDNENEEKDDEEDNDEDYDEDDYDEDVEKDDDEEEYEEVYDEEDDEEDYEEENLTENNNDKNSVKPTEQNVNKHDDYEKKIKIIKLNISENTEEMSDTFENSNNLDFYANDDSVAVDDTDEIPEISEDYTEEILSLKYDEEKQNENKSQIEDTMNNSETVLKTNEINLENEFNDEIIEYSKLPLSKLRGIAIEKGLTTTSNAQKIKKQELIKMLEDK